MAQWKDCWIWSDLSVNIALYKSPDLSEPQSPSAVGLTDADPGHFQDSPYDLISRKNVGENLGPTESSTQQPGSTLGNLRATQMPLDSHGLLPMVPHHATASRLRQAFQQGGWCPGWQPHGSSLARRRHGEHTAMKKGHCLQLIPCVKLSGSG